MESGLRRFFILECDGVLKRFKVGFKGGGDCGSEVSIVIIGCVSVVGVKDFRVLLYWV